MKRSTSIESFLFNTKTKRKERKIQFNVTIPAKFKPNKKGEPIVIGHQGWISTLPDSDSDSDLDLGSIHSRTTS